MLALTFANKEDYNKIQEDDIIDITGLTSFASEKPLTLILNHSNGTKESISVNHTYNASQIGWFKAGSALNKMGKASVKKAVPSKKATPKNKTMKKAAPKKVVKKAVAKKVVKKVAKKVTKKAAKKIVKSSKKVVKKIAKKSSSKKIVKKATKRRK